MARQSYRTVVPSQPWNRDATLVLQGAMTGKINNVFDTTLATGTSVTALAFPLIGPESQIVPVPTNTHAATLGIMWADAQTNGAAILHHLTATATASVRFTVWGG